MNQEIIGEMRGRCAATDDEVTGENLGRPAGQGGLLDNRCYSSWYYMLQKKLENNWKKIQLHFMENQAVQKHESCTTSAHTHCSLYVQCRAVLKFCSISSFLIWDWLILLCSWSRQGERQTPGNWEMVFSAVLEVYRMGGIFWGCFLCECRVVVVDSWDHVHHHHVSLYSGFCTAPAFLQPK